MTGCECHGLERPNALADGCDCDGCLTLRAEMAIEPPLDPDIGCHLLIRGWPGGLSRGEYAYVQAHAEWARKSAERARQRLAENPELLANLRHRRVPAPETKSVQVAGEDDSEAMSA